MAFSTCTRTSWPHALFLEDTEGTKADSRSLATGIHYVRGTIQDDATGDSYGVEPRGFHDYRRRTHQQGPPSSPARRMLEDDDAPVVLADHYVYSVESAREVGGVGLKCIVDDHELPPDDNDNNRRSLMPSDVEPINVDDLLPPNSRRQLFSTRVIEFFGLNDKSRYDTLGAGTEDDTLDIINGVQGLYGMNGVASGFDTNFQITVTEQLTFVTGDPWGPNPAAPVYPQPGEIYTLGLLKEVSNYSWYFHEGLPFDNAHLFSGENFNATTVGLAWLQTMCRPYYSTGISMTDVISNSVRVQQQLEHA